MSAIGTFILTDRQWVFADTLALDNRRHDEPDGQPTRYFHHSKFTQVGKITVGLCGQKINDKEKGDHIAEQILRQVYQERESIVEIVRRFEGVFERVLRDKWGDWLYTTFPCVATKMREDCAPIDLLFCANEDGDSIVLKRRFLLTYRNGTIAIDRVNDDERALPSDPGPRLIQIGYLAEISDYIKVWGVSTDLLSRPVEYLSGLLDMQAQRYPNLVGPPYEVIYIDSNGPLWLTPRVNAVTAAYGSVACL